jgi:thiopurine S-methyltransferase
MFEIYHQLRRLDRGWSQAQHPRMQIDFWAARWKEGQIGFHEGRTNTFLERHVDRLGPAPRRVLVPLCGKTEDLAFLAAQGHEVVGIEAIEDAVKAFFEEHGQTPAVRELRNHIRAYSVKNITIFAGDVFACDRDIVGKVDALYDRAALVALEPQVRPRYVAHLLDLLEPSSRGLILTLEYDESKVSPPPHSVSEDELRRSYSKARLSAIDEGSFSGPKFRAAGIVARERCFALEL